MFLQAAMLSSALLPAALIFSAGSAAAQFSGYVRLAIPQSTSIVVLLMKVCSCCQADLFFNDQQCSRLRTHVRHAQK